MPPPAPFGLVRLRVVDRKTRAAVPRAHGWVWEPVGAETYAETRELLSTTVDVEFLLSTHGTEFTTDEFGVALVVAPREEAWAFARAGTRSGIISIWNDPFDENTIAIQTATTLEVRVVNALGDGIAGARVGLGSAYDDDLDLATFTAGADGRLRVPNFESFLARRSCDEGEPLALRALTLDEQRVERVFLPECPPQEPIIFVLRGRSTIDVRVVARDGSVLPLDGKVSLNEVRRTVSATSMGWQTHPNSELPLVKGHARIEHVPCGIEFEVRAWITGVALESYMGEGPKTEGETLVVDLVVEDLSVLSARLLRPDRKPLADAVVAWKCWSVERSDSRPGSEIQLLFEDLEGLQMCTDGAGRLQWLQRSAVTDSGESKLVRIESTIEEGRVIFADHDPGNTAAGIVDLGDIVLDQEASLRGRVIDGAGRGVAGVLLNASARLASNATTDFVGVEPVLSGAQGEFELPVPCLGLRVQIDPISSVYGQLGSEWIGPACESESRAIEIRVAQAAQITGSALVDDDANTFELTMWFELDGGNCRYRSTPSRHEQGRIRFVIESGVSGAGTVNFRNDITRETILRVTGIVARPGERISPSELIDVDLRGLLPRSGQAKPGPRMRSISVVDESGQPIAMARTSVVSLNDTPSISNPTVVLGHFEILSEFRGRIELSGPGRRAVIFDAASEQDRVVLGPAFTLDLHFHRPRERAATAYALAVALIPLPGTFPPNSRASGPSKFTRCDEHDRVQIHVPYPGPYQVRIEAVLQNAPQAEITTWFDLSASIQKALVVDEMLATQLVELVLAPEIVKAVLDESESAEDEEDH